MGKHCVHAAEAGITRFFLFVLFFLLRSDAALEKLFSYLLCIFSLDCRLLNTSLFKLHPDVCAELDWILTC